MTYLVPGVVDGEFFEHAGLLDTSRGAQGKADHAAVAEISFHAMMDGEGDVVAGLKNKLELALAKLTGAAALAVQDP